MKHNSNTLDININLNELSNIPSVKYRKRLNSLCRSLYKKTGIIEFSFYLLGPQADDCFWLCSSVPRVIIRYLCNHKWIFVVQEIAERCLKNGYHIFNDWLDISQSNTQIHDIMRSLDAAVLPTYAILRQIGQFNVMMICRHEDSKMNKHLFYKRNVKTFEAFGVNLISSCLDIICEYHPQIENNRLFHERNILSNIMRIYSPIKMDSLYAGELAVIYWAAQGMATSEIAEQLHYSKKTVATYRKRVLRKLNAHNMAQAIYLAKKQNLIP